MSFAISLKFSKLLPMLRINQLSEFMVLDIDPCPDWLNLENPIDYSFLGGLSSYLGGFTRFFR